MTHSGFAYELPKLALHIDESESSSSHAMLPTPQASLPQDAETPQTWLERRERMKEKGYNGNGAGMSLPIAVALLPTPGAHDHTGGELETRHARGDAGPVLRDIGHLLPTPVAKDADAARRSGRTEEWESHSGTTLTDAIALLPTPTTQDAANTAGPSQHERNSEPLNVVATKLLPTPAAVDGSGGRLTRDPETLRTGRRPSGSKAGTTLATEIDRLLPTPKTSSVRTSRRAMVETPQWSAPNIAQALELARGELPREFETWEEVPGWSGDHMGPQSDAGSPSADGLHPDQLTIADA